MSRHSSIIFPILGTAFIYLIFGCSNSEYTKSIECEDNFYSDSSQTEILDYLPLDDSEFPYADIPRIVIETENFKQIRDRETEIPAKLQVWGEKAPQSEIMKLTIRGRGNSSWSMPKKSYKIEFSNKQNLLGLPKDKDWALIANYADKTLIRNYIAYNLSSLFNAYYVPRCTFTELYINRKYLGVYLLTETIKKGINRINIPNKNFYLIEIDEKHRTNEQIFFASEKSPISPKKPYRVHLPKNATNQELSYIQDYINNFEQFLIKINPNHDNKIDQWIDIDEFIKYYWVQEFSKQPDAFVTSYYFSLQQNNVLKMGPVWDFDLAFGNFHNEGLNNHHYWYIKNLDWNKYIFQDSTITKETDDFWLDNRDKFESVFKTIDSLQAVLQLAAQNNFKKWPILQSSTNLYHHRAYSTYNDAIEDLKGWIAERLRWIDSQIGTKHFTNNNKQ